MVMNFGPALVTLFSFSSARPLLSSGEDFFVPVLQIASAWSTYSPRVSSAADAEPTTPAASATTATTRHKNPPLAPIAGKLETAARFS